MIKNESHSHDQESPQPTLLSAREDRERLRNDRVIGHAVLGVAALGLFLVTLPIIGGLVMFVLGIAAFYVGLRSFTFAISIALDDAWGWNRDGGLSAPITWSDRAVVAGMAWVRRRSAVLEETSPATAVGILPGDPPE